MSLIKSAPDYVHVQSLVNIRYVLLFFRNYVFFIGHGGLYAGVSAEN